MTNNLFLLPVLSVLFIISCSGDIIKEKQVLTPVIPLKFGESHLFTKYGLSVEFKKMDTDSFALIFLMRNDSTENDSLPANINEIILGISLRSEEVDSGFKLIFTDNYTQLAIRSVKSRFEPVFHQAIEIIFNQSFNSALNTVDGIDPEDLQRYSSDKFVTSRMAFKIVGNFEVEQIESLIERYFHDRTVGTGLKIGFNYPLDNIFLKNTEIDSTETDSLNSG